MRKCQRLWVGLAIVSLVWIAGGCVHHQELSYGFVAPVANPSGGPAVKVTTVTDMRKFQAEQPNPQTPTVDKSSEVGDRAVTLRAIGRADNNGHKFYFHYPKDRTVEMVVRTAVENALRTKGYCVVAENSPAAASAIPVSVEIRKFWVWEVPGFWTMALNFELEADVKSSIVRSGGTESVAIHRENNTGWLNDAVCGLCVEEGLGDFTTNLQSKLKSPK